ncbi:hypothetical protein OBBRIDRAFT_784745 [Obba rivulosa]|uniref:Ubiquitin 3 binding protein But2 C-terminal domain-containing protein n=1 Tax=Obba rivulosa TaxID=1052685 RepID=A0A8E2DF34_9APHY|nr:hypothetical protein OBBRIDRAFT_784745 [Obba rivulosa]
MLLDDDQSSVDLCQEQLFVKRRRCAHLIPQSLVGWLGLCAIVIGISDIFAMLYVSHLLRTLYPDPSVDNSQLEIANQYIGLADLYASGKFNASTIAPILVEPRAVGQVYRDHPDQLALIHAHEHITQLGTVSPREQHLLVNPNTHTIAQFRAVDFGMEDCSLVIKLPNEGELLEGGLQWNMGAGSNFVVHALDAKTPLDLRKLSWRTRPARLREIARFAPRAGEESFVARLPYKWSSLHTFEVSCASDCLLDVRSTHNGTWGVWLYQHQTV